MSGHSISVDFWLDEDYLICTNWRSEAASVVNSVLEEYTKELDKFTEVDLPSGKMFIYGSEKITLTIHLHDIGLVTSSLEYLVSENNVNINLISMDDAKNIETSIKEKLPVERVKVLPPLKRAPPINPYFMSSDERILEYDVQSLEYEKTNEFQKVQIFNTKSFGNILILDDLQNLAESDLAYTHGLMNKGEESYKDKEILILGGGDGALLHELLKEDPKFVIMIDIDEDVITSCRQFLRSACGECMDEYKGDNYEIIIGDAFAYMEKYLEEGRKFDYVFADLTDCPIVSKSEGELWDFIKSAMNNGSKLLHPRTGKYMTHATGIQCKNALEMFEELFEKIDVVVSYKMTSHYVPSFCEKWCFYQATREV